MSVKSRIGILLVCLSALVLVGCSSNDEPTATPTSEPTPTATAVPTSAPSPTPADTPTPSSDSAEVQPTAQPTSTPSAAIDASDRRSGGIFTRLWADPPTLDPALVTDSTSSEIVIEIFSGLMKLTGDNNNPVVPDLAESFRISEDGKTYTFVLRDDLKFSDGSPVTAEDFRWSWERAASPETGSPIVEEFLGDIVGIKDMAAGEATTASGIQVPDDRTLVLTIDAPKPYFIAKLTYPITFVVNRNNVETGDNWTDEPVGTGPFILKEYTIGERIVLARNDHYWGELAYLDEVHLILAGGSAMAMYENDEIDVTGVGLSSLERVQDPNEEISNDLVRVEPQFSVSYMGFNVDEPPFDDVHFRRALNYAVDKELVAEQALSDLVRPANGVIPPGFVGFNAGLEPLTFDPEKAMEELQLSKYADPNDRPRIVLTLPGTGGTPSLTVQVIADMWARNLDVNVEIQQVEWATFLDDLNRRRLQAFSLGWWADYPDPHTFIDSLFRSDSTINHTGYSNEDVDALLAQANTEMDPVRRIELYQEAEQIIVDEASWLPLWWGTEGMALVKPHVRGLTFPQLSAPRYQYIWLEE